MIEYGLVGGKLGHSYSPRIHNLLADYHYELIECNTQEMAALLRSRAFKGLNVTIPHKRDAMSLCDILSEEARSVGCVNTIVNQDGVLYGHNTDVDGFVSLVRRAGADPTGEKVLVLGSGGTSLTARTALHRLGAREVAVVSRSGPVTYEAAHALHKDACWIVNTTPVGMFPNAGLSPIDLNDFPSAEVAVDAIYNPFRTALLLDAAARGMVAADGLWMLVAQARRAAELFAGREIGDDRVEQVFRTLRRETVNLVLIGMPGSGKSVIAKAVAKRMGREFSDADQIIASRAGMSIPDIFEREGEAGFRAREREVIAELAAGGGRVIATGGGAPLFEENARALRGNGVLIYLKRPLALLAVEGRPLSAGGPEALATMFAARGPVYERMADRAVDNLGDVPDVAERVIQSFEDAIRF